MDLLRNLWLLLLVFEKIHSNITALKDCLNLEFFGKEIKVSINHVTIFFFFSFRDNLEQYFRSKKITLLFAGTSNDSKYRVEYDFSAAVFFAHLTTKIKTFEKMSLLMSLKLSIVNMSLNYD